MVLAQQADQGLGGWQPGSSQQGGEGPLTHQHGGPLQGQAAGHEPGHQRRGPAGAQANHGGVLAVGCVFLHLVEVGTEQHQGGGQGGAAAQRDGRPPGHTLSSGLSRRRQGQQASGGGQRPEGKPAEGFAQAAIAETERRPLVGVADAAAGQHQGQHHRAAAQGHQGHQPKPQQQGPIRPDHHAIAAAGEIHQGVGLAVGIDPCFGVKHIIGQVFPGQQQHRRQQKHQQLIQAHRQARTDPPTGRQQHRHHRHRIHRPLDRRLPQAAALRATIGVKACDDLGLGRGCRQLGVGEGPYI